MSLSEHESLPKSIVDAVDLDTLQLQAQGHAAELPRNFSVLSLLSFSFALMNSWIAFVSLLTVALTLGGPTTAFWSPWLAALGTTLVTLGLAELASAFPSSGGAYQCVPSEYVTAGI
jgi:choline transport protein